MNTSMSTINRPKLELKATATALPLSSPSSGKIEDRPTETFLSSESSESPPGEEASLLKRVAVKPTKVKKSAFLTTAMGIAGFVGLTAGALTGGVPLMAAAATVTLSSGLLKANTAALTKGRGETSNQVASADPQPQADPQLDESLPQHKAHKVGLGTKLGGWAKGIKPLGKEVGVITDDVAAMRARLKRINEELQERPIHDYYGKPIKSSDGLNRAFHRFDGDGHDWLVEELLSLDKEVIRLRSDSVKRLERSIAHRHPELVGTDSMQQETWGSILGTVIGGHAGRTGNMKTVQWETFPGEIDRFGRAIDGLGIRTRIGEGSSIHTALPNSKSLEAVDEALEGLRKLAENVGEPMRP